MLCHQQRRQDVQAAGRTRFRDTEIGDGGERVPGWGCEARERERLPATCRKCAGIDTALGNDDIIIDNRQRDRSVIRRVVRGVNKHL